jgi:hypothetical protein
MESDNLKLTILVDGKPLYFGAPVFLSQKVDGDGVTLILQTEIGMQTKQKLELQIKNPTYVESTPTSTGG